MQLLNNFCFPHQELSHKGRHWHEECFRCTKCYKPLAKEPFNTKDERIMCVKCCSRDAAPRCQSCYKPILAGMTNQPANRYSPLVKEKNFRRKWPNSQVSPIRVLFKDFQGSYTVWKFKVFVFQQLSNYPID